MKNKTMKLFKNKSTLKYVLLLFSMILLSVGIFGSSVKVKGAGSTAFSLIQTSNVTKLAKKSKIDLAVRYQNNTNLIYSFDFTLHFDDVQFDLVKDSLKPADGIVAVFVGEETVEDGVSAIEIKGYTLSGISIAEGDVFTISLVSVKGEATSAISFLINDIGVYDADTKIISLGDVHAGLNSVNFSKTAIPWWVWLIIFGGLAIAIAGGYVFHLLLPDAIGDAAKATAKAGQAVGKKTKEIAILTANKTKELANRVFNRRPVAPKMKPSVSATSAKPAPQQVSKVVTPVQPKPQPRQKGDLTKPVQPIKPVETPTPTPTPSVDPSNSGANTQFAVPLVSQKPMNQTIIKTRVVNPDGSVTTITKKVSKEAESSDDKK